MGFARFGVTLPCEALGLARDAIRVTGGKRRRRIVFESELNGLCRVRSGDLRRHVERKINSCRDAAARNDFAVLHEARLLEFRTDESEQVGVGPMRGRTAPPE